MRALIVDDRQEITRLVSACCQEEGIVTVCCNSYKEGFSHLDQKFDLLFFDEILEDGNNGTGLAHLYKERWPRSEPIIYTGTEKNLSEPFERINKIIGYDGIKDAIRKAVVKMNAVDIEEKPVLQMKCSEHFGIVQLIERDEKDIQKLFDVLKEASVDFNSRFATLQKEFDARFTKILWTSLTAAVSIIIMCGTWVINNLHHLLKVGP
jgi:CheY-like chemotaxis protein